MCFECGNCFCECTCGTQGCPGSDFWANLRKNATAGATLLSLDARERLEKDALIVKPEEIRKYLGQINLKPKGV